MKTKTFLTLVIVSLILTGCASINDRLTPNAKMVKNHLDNSIEVIQDNVSASSSLNEGRHELGIIWTSRAKDIIILNVGKSGIEPIQGAALDIGGDRISLQKTDFFTNFEFTPNMDWSYKRYRVSMKNFLKIATADTVKIKIKTSGKYTVSTFGTDHLEAAISNKFPEFLSLLEKNGVNTH